MTTTSSPTNCRRPGLHHRAAPARRGPGPAGSVLLGAQCCPSPWPRSPACYRPSDSRSSPPSSAMSSTALYRPWDGSVTWTSRKSNRLAGADRPRVVVTIETRPAPPMAHLTGAELRVWLDWLAWTPPRRGRCSASATTHGAALAERQGAGAHPGGQRAGGHRRRHRRGCRRARAGTPRCRRPRRGHLPRRRGPVGAATRAAALRRPMVAHGGGLGHGEVPGVEIQWHDRELAQMPCHLISTFRCGGLRRQHRHHASGPAMVQAPRAHRRAHARADPGGVRISR